LDSRIDAGVKATDIEWSLVVAPAPGNERLKEDHQHRGIADMVCEVAARSPCPFIGGQSITLEPVGSRQARFITVVGPSIHIPQGSTNFGIADDHILLGLDVPA
jgi:hypothetical protein